MSPNSSAAGTEIKNAKLKIKKADQSRLVECPTLNFEGFILISFSHGHILRQIQTRFIQLRY